MDKLPETSSLPDVISKLNDLIELTENIPVRIRGPRSTRAMTRQDAWRVLHGDLKKTGHKEAAEELGLSYGQIYSARGTYTFKDVKKDEFKTGDVVKLVTA